MISTLRRVIVPILMVLSLSGSIGICEGSGAEKLYDIQVGCYTDSDHIARLADSILDRGLHWYSVGFDHCTRFIVDVNVSSSGRAAFASNYPEFPDAFLVDNYWDLPHPDPMKISPLPAREEFLEIMTPYMQQQYQNGYYNRKGLSLDGDRARMYTGFIYDAGQYYGIDPFLIFALGNFETYFYNTFGDLHRLEFRRPDPAQGMFQILRSTARLIYKEMKRQNLPHTPKDFPGDLRRYPKAQIYFAAHYLHKLYTKHCSNRYMALLGYNSVNNPNYEYPRKVMRFYQRAIRHFLASSGQRISEELTAEGAPGSGKRESCCQKEGEQ
jgi:hypothetical protein